MTILATQATPATLLLSSVSSADTSFLTGLLAESPPAVAAVLPQAAKSEAQGLDDFLNELLGESMKEKEARDRLKACRKTVKNTALSGTARNKLQAEISQLEYVAEWTAVADVIWIKRCVCDQCGHETPQFAGYFRKAHSRLSKAYRWTALSADAESSLPREIKEEMTTTPMCADCLPAILMEDGWLNAEPVQEEFGIVGQPGTDDEEAEEEEEEEEEEEAEEVEEETAEAVGPEEEDDDPFDPRLDVELAEEELENGPTS